MSNKSGTSSQVISLPKGGGALKGIGESFSPDLHTGTGNFTVPITLPPGRSGFQPQLNLVYSTGNGNGLFGLGWSLSVPGVSRKTSKGVPIYDDAADTFILSGAEDLVPVEQDGAATCYRPRTEGLFARIVHVVDQKDNYWRVESKDGLISEYGTRDPTGADPATTTSYDDPRCIFAWKLAQTRDPFGNLISYEYEADAGDDGVHAWRQPLLKRICYADYDEAGETRFFITVTFDYEERPDPFSDYRAGFEIRTTKRVCKITVETHAGPAQVARIYHLMYLDQQPATTQELPPNHVSLLSQIWVEGRDEQVLNLLPNAGFETIGPYGPVTTFTSAAPFHGRPSAALSWDGLIGFVPGTIITELLAARSPFGTALLRVTTTAQGSGLVKVFGDYDTGPKSVHVGVWVFVVRGQVGVGVGNGGNTSTTVKSATTGVWEYLKTTNNAGQPANELTMYVQSAGGAEFYVAFVSVSERSRAEWLPPLSFGYTSFQPERRRDFFPLTGAQVPFASLGRPEYELADLTGDGLPDILEINGAVRYWRNLGGGRFDPPRPMHTAPAGHILADPGVQLIDADGDGHIDLLVTQPGRAGYHPLRYDATWGPYQSYKYAPSFNLEDPEVKLVDLDGDGVTDAIRSGSRLECFLNNPAKGGWQRPILASRRSLEVFPDVNFSDPRVKWGDMSGDGLQDIVLVSNRNVEYWPSMGRGAWGKRISMRRSPRFPYGYDPRRILVGDVDGDGLADIVYVDDTQVTLWINQSGNAWSEPIEISGTPPVSDMDAVRLVDMLGSGVSGILWSADANGSSSANMFFLDLTGAVKPYLLAEMDNNLGAVTKVEYAPSTRFYLNDQQSPETRWRTSLPLPVQVVARVEVIDALSQGKLTTTYRYHDGYWDGAEREFRGFGMVEQLDSERFAADYNRAGLHGEELAFEPVAEHYFAHPTLTKTWFHQGPVGPEFGDWQADIDRSGDYWPGDPPLLNQKEFIDPFLRGLAGGNPRSRRIRRDALRTLRGSVLRTELYALDGSERQERPYTVTESQYSLREEAQPDDDSDRQRIFFPHLVGQRTTQWERGDDPLTQFAFTGEYDEYGQPRRQTQIACPRGWRSLADTPGAGYLATRTWAEYARCSDVTVYIKDRVCRTTSYELTNTAGQTVLALRGRKEDDADLAIIGQTLNFYDRDPSKPDNGAFVGLPFCTLGHYGALVRTDTLVLTDDTLRGVYEHELPAYLERSRPANWADAYPPEFGARVEALPGLAGYQHKPDANYADGYFVSAERRRYDFHGSGVDKVRGLLLAQRDPLDKESRIVYDQYNLLPVEVAEIFDPKLPYSNGALVTYAAYNYRAMQPVRMIDPNGNLTEFAFSPLGQLEAAWVKGKNDPQQPEGDRERPSVELAYDFHAFMRHRQPVFVASTRRVHHDTDLNVPEPERGETIETREYSDGFGRLLQTRTQGEAVRFGENAFGGGERILPASQSAGRGGPVEGREDTDPNNPNVVVSGWQTYDNKGRVVEKYEPFFHVGWDYQPPVDDQLGQKATLFYDPRGQVIRTRNPDGSEQRVIYGVPSDLADPESFTATPWEIYTYDANDNAGRTPAADPAAGAYAHHWDTPASATIDALGRTVESIVRNREKPAQAGASLPPIEAYRITSTYDIRGNLLVVTDPLGRAAFSHSYDLANRPLRIVSIDAGERRTVLDAAGNILETRDSKGARTLCAYDRLSRPTHLWTRDGTGELLTLRERLLYGDDPALNLRGRLSKHYDEAGLLTLAAYDFKGNLLEKVRRTIKPELTLAAIAAAQTNNWRVAAYRVDWQPSETAPTLEAHAQALLAPAEYTTTLAYDALNRITTMQYPEDVDGQRKLLRPAYNRAGALERVSLDGAPYVSQIAYNAKGQRVLIAYGNQVLTRYAYDERTFRLLRLRTERYTTSDGLTYQPGGGLLQDFAYSYDLAGNILGTTDITPGCGLPADSDRLVRAFTYDSLYRLLSATGRETDFVPPPPGNDPAEPWEGRPHKTDHTIARAYSQSYSYDPAGNMTRLGHSALGNSFNRNFAFQGGQGAVTPANNRLATMTIGTTQYSYAYDANGNLERENSERHYEWDHADHMKVFRQQTLAAGSSEEEDRRAEPTTYAHYLYDSGGQRVLKVVYKQAGPAEVTVYIDGVFEHHLELNKTNSGVLRENNTLHIMDDQSRIALLRVGEAFPGDGAPDVKVKYHLGDHLGSSSVVIDESGALINREEYYPYGETSFGSFEKKRYRFTGKERDEESGLYYHGARYYAPWLARWVSCDPLAGAARLNPYEYVRQSPLGYKDPSGLSEVASVSDSSAQLNNVLTPQNPPTNNRSYDKYGNFQPPKPGSPPMLSPMTNEEFSYQHGFWDPNSSYHGQFRSVPLDVTMDRDLDTGRTLKGKYTPDFETVYRNGMTMRSTLIDATYEFQNGYWSQVEGRPEAEQWSEKLRSEQWNKTHGPVSDRPTASPRPPTIEDRLRSYRIFNFDRGLGRPAGETPNKPLLNRIYDRLQETAPGLQLGTVNLKGPDLLPQSASGLSSEAGVVVEPGPFGRGLGVGYVHDQGDFSVNAAVGVSPYSNYTRYFSDGQQNSVGRGGPLMQGMLRGRF